MTAIKPTGAGPGGELALGLGEKTGQPLDISPEHVAFQENLGHLALAQIDKLVHLDTGPQRVWYKRF